MSSIAYDLFEAAPSWVRLFIVLGVSYVAYSIWSAIARFNREWKVASRILDERRKAGIPDTDKRPFRIAKAAVDATRSSSDHTLKHRVTFSSDSQDGLQSSHIYPNNTREEGLERTNVSSKSKARRRSSLAPRTSATSDPKAPGSSQITSPPSLASMALFDPHQKPDQQSRLKHKRAYAPSEFAPSEISHCGSPDIISQTRTTKKVKTKSTLKSPNKRGLPSTAELNRKKTKLSLPGDLSIQEGPAEDGYGSQDEDSHMAEIEKGRKRILSQAVSEAELSHELKHKRGKSARQSDDDELERQPTDMNDLSPSDGDKMQEDGTLEVDQDVFMITENGQRKKLIKIKPLSDNQSDQQMEDSIERRWVTRSEFERLKRTGKLHDSEEIWDDRSTTPSDTMNISVDYSISNPTHSPRARQTTEVEYGPIWSIEGKPSSRPSLSETTLTARLRTSARPRNSLGRMRLSLPPDPVSPAPRSRSKINSLLQDDRYIDDKTSGESELAIQSTSEEQARQASLDAGISGRSPRLSSQSATRLGATSSLQETPPESESRSTVDTNPVSTPQPEQMPPSSTTGHPSTTSTAFNVGTTVSKQQASSDAVQPSNNTTSLFAPKATGSLSFGSLPSSVSPSEVSKTQPPASSSPFSFGAVAANAESTTSQPLFGNNNANPASSGFAQSTHFSTSEALPKTVAVAPKVDLANPTPFEFNPVSPPALVKEKSIFQSSESSSAFSFKSTNSPGGNKANKPGFSAGTSKLPSPQPPAKPAASTSFSPFGAPTTPFSFETGQPSTKASNSPSSGTSPAHTLNKYTGVKSNTIGTTSNFSFGHKSIPDPSSSKQVLVDANTISATSASLSGSGSDSSLTLETTSPSQETRVSQEKSGSTADQESTPGRRTARLKSNRLAAGPQRVLANAMSNVGKQVGLSTVKLLQNEPSRSTETIDEEAEAALSSTEDGATKVSASDDLARPSMFGNVNASTQGTNKPSSFSFSATPQSESTQSTTTEPVSFMATSVVPTSTVSAFGSATTPSFSFGTPAKSTVVTSSLPPASGGGISAFSFGSTTIQTSNPLDELSKPTSSFSFERNSDNNINTFSDVKPTFGAPSSAPTNPAASTTTTTPLFGATPNLFGNPTASSITTNIFAKPAASNTTTSVFGNPTASSTTPSIFGNPTASTTTTSMFGNSTTTAATPSMFGNSTTSITTPSLFGNPTASTTTPSSFGNPAASSDKPMFGNPAGSSSAFSFNTGSSSTTNPNPAGSTPLTFNFTVSAPQVAAKEDDQKK